MVTFCLRVSSLRNLGITSNQSHGLMTEKADAWLEKVIEVWNVCLFSGIVWAEDAYPERRRWLYRIVLPITKSVVSYWKSKYELHTGRTFWRTATETNEMNDWQEYFLALHSDTGSRQKKYYRWLPLGRILDRTPNVLPHSFFTDEVVYLKLDVA